MANEMRGITVLPDGSAFGAMSFPLPGHHWLYQPELNVPPMGLRCGLNDPTRKQLQERVVKAARYAVRSATRNGAEADFDPDALVQNMVVGLIGYFTDDGLSGENFGNPPVIPPTVTVDFNDR